MNKQEIIRELQVQTSTAFKVPTEFHYFEDIDLFQVKIYVTTQVGLVVSFRNIIKEIKKGQPISEIVETLQCELLFKIAEKLFSD